MLNFLENRRSNREALWKRNGEEAVKDITTIPYDELIKDRQESELDIPICEAALKIGVTTHKDGTSVQERIDVNKLIIVKIDLELERRRTQ